MIRQPTRRRQGRGFFPTVRGNARVISITEGVAAVSFQWYRTYVSLYMVALGVTALQIGWLESVLIFTQFISTLMGGYFADRFGRKRVLVVFDILCWGVPMGLYAIARNPWYFLIGRFINGFVYVVNPSFQCLFVEDVPAEHRAAVFRMVQFLSSGARLLAPAAGFLVAMLGIIPAGRILAAILSWSPRSALRSSASSRCRRPAWGGHAWSTRWIWPPGNWPGSISQPLRRCGWTGASGSL